MIKDSKGVVCPSCDSEMENGYLSYCSGAVWHREKPKGLRRLFWSAISGGEPVYGSLLFSLPVVSSVDAWRCPKCSCVLVSAQQTDR